LILLILFSVDSFSQSINRQAVVQRHNVHITKIDSLSLLTVGNGNFAFTVDATGMQSFLKAPKELRVCRRYVWEEV